MGPEIAVPLAIASTAGGAGLAASGASSANRGLEASRRSARRAAMMQTEQVAQQAAQERLRSIQQAAQMRARLSVARGAAGVMSGGGPDSYTDLAGQVANDLAQNLMAIRFNQRAQSDRIRSGYESQVIALRNQMQNPLLAGVAGGLQGLQAGMSAIQGINQIGAYFSGPTLTPNTMNAAAVTGMASGTPFPWGVLAR